MKRKRVYRVTNPLKVEFIGKKYLEKSEIQIFTYSPDSYNEVRDIDASSARISEKKDAVTWMNIHGIHDSELISNVCSNIKLPRFIIQDILDTNQRTKLQDLGDYMFFSVKSILVDEKLDFDIEQISFIIGHNSLYSFQEKRGDHFEHIRVRIREDNGLVRHKGPDFLLFLLLEGILANYFSTVDRMEDTINEKADPLKNKDTGPAIIHDIEENKRKLHSIRKNLQALKEALLSIEKGSSKVIGAEQIKYFYDLRDSCLLLQENIDSLSIRLDSSENLFFSMQGHRMNQVMSTLTIMAAIFIPLTFMAGIYGMNFTNMPELEWEWGYFSLLGVMLVVTIGLIVYFKKRKWF